MKTISPRPRVSRGRKPAPAAAPKAAIPAVDVTAQLERHAFPAETRRLIESENLLPPRLVARLHAAFTRHSSFGETRPVLFTGRAQFSGLEGFREVTAVLAKNGISLSRIPERELFIEVYRFKATRHVLNAINWDDYVSDPLFQLVFPQPGMMRQPVVDAYLAATSDAARTKVAEDYIHQTNPHDGKQLLNKPWLEQVDGGIEILEGSQHKYPQCQLVFDHSTQNCFAFCTYCFRHAQVRGDHDMFIQDDIAQIHKYLRVHREVTDVLITGGDAGFIPASRLRQYVMPILEDPALLHIRAVRLGSRLLTFEPERILSKDYEPTLALFSAMRDQGVQPCWMAHFSTPRELLNPATIAAIRRLQNHGVTVRSQSPIMNHVSLFMDDAGQVDVEKSARNWIDLAEILAMLSVRFHSMYCARNTGEHHYFTAPLSDIEKVANLVYRSLASLHRPSRYITMTTSAGKLSILGTAEVGGETVFALKFNESRNMAWMDRVFLAKYDRKENKVDRLVPFDTDKFFFADELAGIEKGLAAMHQRTAGAAPAPVPAVNGPRHD